MNEAPAETTIWSAGSPKVLVCAICDFETPPTVKSARMALYHHTVKKHRVPKGGRDATNEQVAILGNERLAQRMHKDFRPGGWSKTSEMYVRPQYAALLEVVGSTELAEEYLDTAIIYPNQQRPELRELTAWNAAYVMGELVPQKDLVARMESRMHRIAKWKNLSLVGAMVGAAKADSQRIKDDTLDPAKQVRVKYNVDGIGQVTSHTAAAFPSPKPSKQRSGSGMKAIGKKPEVKALPEGTVAGEFRIVEDASATSGS